MSFYNRKNTALSKPKTLITNFVLLTSKLFSESDCKDTIIDLLFPK
jgi:hypothetical protein